MQIRVADIVDKFHAPNKGKGELFIEPAPHHKRVVRSIARCPWHKEMTASLLADHSKGTFRCTSCGVEGILVEGTDDRFLVLQREDD